jgi:hypothetical protein
VHCLETVDCVLVHFDRLVLLDEHFVSLLELLVQIVFAHFDCLFLIDEHFVTFHELLVQIIDAEHVLLLLILKMRLGPFDLLAELPALILDLLEFFHLVSIHLVCFAEDGSEIKDFVLFAYYYHLMPLLLII